MSTHVSMETTLSKKDAHVLASVPYFAHFLRAQGFTSRLQATNKEPATLNSPQPAWDQRMRVQPRPPWLCFIGDDQEQRFYSGDGQKHNMTENRERLQTNNASDGHSPHENMSIIQL